MVRVRVRGRLTPTLTLALALATNRNQVEQFDEGWLCLLHAATGAGAAGPIGGPPRFRTRTSASGVCVRAPHSACASPAAAAGDAPGGHSPE